jgi:hypothetical protein
MGRRRDRGAIGWGTVLTVAVGALLVRGQASAGGGGPPPAGPPPGRRRLPPVASSPGCPAALRSGGADRWAWARSRYAAALEVLATMAMPATLARWIARAAVAHWALETAWGRAERGFNVGNVKWTFPHLCQTLPDGLRYRRYLTLVAGVLDYFVLVSRGRYRSAWDGLVADATAHGAALDAGAWLAALQAAGYSPVHGANLDEIRAIYRQLGAVVGSG